MRLAEASPTFETGCVKLLFITLKINTLPLKVFIYPLML